MTDAEWAWLAGLLEGEGCFSTNGKHGRPVIILGMTDEDIVRRVHEMTGYGAFYERKAPSTNKPGWKPCFLWKVGRQDHIRSIMDGILPWMGERRSARIKELYEKSLTMRKWSQ